MTALLDTAWPSLSLQAADKIFLWSKRRGWSIMALHCRYSSSVERQLPKLERRVRFPLSAHKSPETKLAFRGFYSTYFLGRYDIISETGSER